MILLRRIRGRLRKELAKRRPLQPQLSGYLAGQAIARAILLEQPFLAGRLGYTESRCLDSVDEHGRAPARVRDELWEGPGVFPPTEDHFIAFQRTYLGALGEVDLLGLLGTMDERRLIERHARSPLTCKLEDLEPYFSPCPWSKFLNEKRILVVHPFVQSVEKQYREHRAQLFLNSDVLPEFQLQTVKAPQCVMGNTDGHESWSTALDELKNSISHCSFDVAIIGCGAFGLPVGAYVKSLGKVAIHLGGATQILFGILGRRWLNRQPFRALMTPAWRPPLEAERPPRWELHEGGSYW